MHVNKKGQPGYGQDKSFLSFLLLPLDMLSILCLFSMWTKFICTMNRMAFQREGQGDFLT